MRFLGLLPFALLLPVACTDPLEGNEDPPPDEEIPVGQEGGACSSEGLCDTGLVCANGICALDPLGEGEGEECPDGSQPRPEYCSFEDENCDGQNNEDLDCTFLAHGRDVLYRVDPFREVVTIASQVTLPGNSGLLDADRDPDGSIVTATADGIYVVYDGALLEIASIEAPPFTTGLAINDEGVLYLTNNDGEDSAAWKVDTETDEVTLFGSLAPYASSGDCVVTKDERLLMTSPDPADETAPDLLVEISQANAAATPIGPVGFDKVYGLSASWNHLFGVTDAGDVLLINPDTGAGELLFSTEFQFWGASNGD
jgi:hypothetical protein